MPALETGQGRGALRLRAVTVNHGRGKSLANQALGQPLGSALGAREDQAAARFPGEQALQDFLLAIMGDFKGLHAHVLARA